MFLSVIISSFNQKEYVAYLMRGLNLQEFQEFELLIVDDGSTDGTEEYIKNIKTIYPRRFLAHPDKEGFSIAKCKNTGIREARGEYCLISDGDTFFGPTTITAFLPYLKKHPRAGLMGLRKRVDWNQLNTKRVDLDDLEKAVVPGYEKDWRLDWRGLKTWGDNSSLPDIPNAPYTVFSGANVMFPTDQLREIGGWAPDDFEGFGYDDYYLALNWLAHGYEFKAVNGSYGYHVYHTNTKGAESSKQYLLSAEKDLAPKVLEYFPDYASSFYRRMI